MSVILPSTMQRYSSDPTNCYVADKLMALLRIMKAPEAGVERFKEDPKLLGFYVELVKNRILIDERAQVCVYHEVLKSMYADTNKGACPKEAERLLLEELGR